jgi:hypothetical protein
MAMSEGIRVGSEWLLALLVLTLMGCSSVGRQQEQGKEPSRPNVSVAPFESTETSAPDSIIARERPGSTEAERLTLLAIQEMARRSGVPEGEFSRLSVTGETWRDASLGCPEPGRVYAQVLTPGYRVVLEARGQRYEFHTDEKRVVLCPGL